MQLVVALQNLSIVQRAARERTDGVSTAAKYREERFRVDGAER